MSRLEGRRALITGASSGMGRATAHAFVREGAQVALLARGSQGLEVVARELGGAAVVVPADITDDAQVEAAVARAIEALGGLDTAVNCAATAEGLSLAEATPEHFRRTIDVNLSGCYYVARACGLHMLQQGDGTIINVASEAAMRGTGAFAAYCASKAGVVNLTRALADELAPSVTVNCVCPGPTDTPMLRGSLEATGDYDGAYAQLLDRVPLHRVAAPEEIAAGVVYFASDARHTTTGAILALDGGTTAVA